MSSPDYRRVIEYLWIYVHALQSNGLVDLPEECGQLVDTDTNVILLAVPIFSVVNLVFNFLYIMWLLKYISSALYSSELQWFTSDINPRMHYTGVHILMFPVHCCPLMPVVSGVHN